MVAADAGAVHQAREAAAGKGSIHLLEKADDSCLPGHVCRESVGLATGGP